MTEDKPTDLGSIQILHWPNAQTAVHLALIILEEQYSDDPSTGPHISLQQALSLAPEIRQLATSFAAEWRNPTNNLIDELNDIESDWADAIINGLSSKSRRSLANSILKAKNLTRPTGSPQ